METNEGFKGMHDTNFSSLGLTKTHNRRRGLFLKKPDLAKKACESLGFDFNELTMKTKEELHDPKKSAEINNLKYEHYKQRYHKRAAQVEAKIKDLLQAGRVDLFITQDDHENRRCSSAGSHENSPHHGRQRLDSYQDSVNYAKTARPPRNFNVDFEGDLGLDDQVEIQENEIAKGVIRSYRHKLSKIQEKWNGEIKGMTNKPMDGPGKLLNYAMQDQVERLNRSIDKAEKYAQSIIESNNKREQLREKLLERDQLTIQLRAKFEKERKKNFKKNQETFEDKQKQIKEQKREFSLELSRNASGIKKRFGDLEIKLQNADLQRKKLLKSRSIDFNNKIARVKEQKNAEYEEFYKSFRNEEARCQVRLEALKTDRIIRCNESAKAFEESYNRAVKKRRNFSIEKDAQMIEKLCKKSESTESLKLVIKKEFKKKIKENTEKGVMFKHNLQDIMKNQEEWRSNVIKSYRESQERVKEYQTEKAHELELKKEINLLKRQDHIENFYDLKRIQEMRNVQIIEKEKISSLKQSLIKEQNKILSLARIDVDRRMKVKVDDMIFSALRGGNRSAEPKRPKPAESIDDAL